MSILSCRNLVKEYAVGSEQFTALDKVSIEIDKGEYLAVTGESGSGKTTLLNLLGLIDKPTSGEIIIKGKNVLAEVKDPSSLRNTFFGYVFQNFYLEPNYTAFYNIEIPMIISGIPAKERKPRVDEALKKVGLINKADVKCGKLSGGEKQRICIARAIINEPTVVLADEPCGNLDSANTESIMNLFDELNKSGTTIILVTHSHEEALRANKMIKMKDGKIIEIESN